MDSLNDLCNWLQDFYIYEHFIENWKSIVVAGVVMTVSYKKINSHLKVRLNKIIIDFINQNKRKENSL